MINPVRSASGVFGGQVVALELNVRFSDAGLLPPGFGDLKFIATDTNLDGMTIRQALAAANQVLAGAPIPAEYKYSDLNSIVAHLNEAFDNGAFSIWAQAHLIR